MVRRSLRLRAAASPARGSEPPGKGPSTSRAVTRCHVVCQPHRGGLLVHFANSSELRVICEVSAGHVMLRLR